MLIGQDYPKIEVAFYGLKLLEPNAFLGDVILFLLCWYLAKRTFSMGQSPFYMYWGWFFATFSVATFFGGLGHLFYEYTGTFGKFPSWYLGFVATFFIEQAMISIHQNNKLKTIFKTVSIVKLIIVLLSTTVLYAFFDIPSDFRVGMHFNTVNTFVGFSFSLFYLSAVYIRMYNLPFQLFMISYFILLPAAVFQGLKINIHQWFDRNDIGHCLLFVSITLYFFGIKRFNKFSLSSDK